MYIATFMQTRLALQLIILHLSFGVCICQLTLLQLHVIFTQCNSINIWSLCTCIIYHYLCICYCNVSIFSTEQHTKYDGILIKFICNIHLFIFDIVENTITMCNFKLKEASNCFTYAIIYYKLILSLYIFFLGILSYLVNININLLIAISCVYQAFIIRLTPSEMFTYIYAFFTLLCTVKCTCTNMVCLPTLFILITIHSHISHTLFYTSCGNPLYN